MQPAWTITSRDGTPLAGYELGGTGGEIFLIAHATGLCGAMYQRFAELLTDRFRVVAFDFRGHGDSGTPDLADLAWERMADDVVAVVEHLGGDPMHAFGHSMGGGALLLAERRRPGSFRSLYLFEPIVFPAGASVAQQHDLSAGARRRRAEFASRAEVLERYAAKPPFAGILAGFLADYVEAGFADLAGGGVRLKCPPEVEGRVFENGRQSQLDAVAHLELPVRFVTGRDVAGPAAFAAPAAERLLRGSLVRYDHIDHFGPFQDPWTLAHDAAEHAAKADADT